MTSSLARPLTQKRVYLMYNGWDNRMFPYVEHIAWAAKQIPTMRVTVSSVVCFVLIELTMQTKGSGAVAETGLSQIYVVFAFQVWSGQGNVGTKVSKTPDCIRNRRENTRKVSKVFDFCELFLVVFVFFALCMFILSKVLEPFVALRIAEHSFHPLENFFRKELFTGVSTTKKHDKY
jgi:hypothetical protein